jgi:hypothetical protein
MFMESNVNENQEEKETSAIAEEFDSSAFLTEDDEQRHSEISDTEAPESSKGEEAPQATTEEEQGSEQEDEATEGVAEETEEESYWSLPSDEEEKTNEADDSEVESEDKETNNLDAWNTIAEELGIDAEDYDTFIDTLKTQKQLAQTSATNEKIGALESIIKFDDEKLMRLELKEKGYTADEIEDEIDILIENNTIRAEARKVRKILEGIVVNEREAIASQTQQADATQQQELEEARKELETYMSKTTEMFGGRVNSQQKEQHIQYISSGDFFDEITSNPESMANAAWLWRYRNQILKGMKSNGFEKGKSAILDKMVNPEATRKTNIPDPETGDFNPNRFMDYGQM